MTARPTLVMVTLTDPAGGAGDGVRMRNIIEHLRPAADIDVMTFPWYREDTWRRGGKVIYFLIREFMRALLALRVFLRGGDQLYYTWDWFLARDLGLLSRIRPLTYILEANGLHSYESELRGHFRRGGFMHRYYVCRAERTAARGAARIVAVSSGLSRTIADLYNIPPDSISVAYNGADPDVFPYIPPPAAGDEIIIGWAGSFQPYEGFSRLIDAAEEFRRRGRNVRFIVVGEGLLRRKYQVLTDGKGLSDSFDFRGRVSWENVPAELAPAHLCVMIPDMSPVGREYRDAIGVTQMKAYEYMALGKPIVTLDTGDAREIIEEAGIGLVAGPDAGALCDAIERIMSSDREVMSRRARDLVVSRYNWRRTARVILEVVGEVGRGRHE